MGYSPYFMQVRDVHPLLLFDIGETTYLSPQDFWILTEELVSIRVICETIPATRSNGQALDSSLKAL